MSQFPVRCVLRKCIQSCKAICYHRRSYCRLIFLAGLFIFCFALVRLSHVMSDGGTPYASPQLVYDSSKDVKTRLKPSRPVTHNTTHINGYPRILHHMYYGIDALRPEWVKARASCLRNSPGFLHMYWNGSAVEEFLTRYYSWFLPKYHSYVYPVQRFDAVRYFLLYHYRGIYIDMDIHCKVNVSSVLESFPVGSAVVLQETVPVGYVTNSLLFAHARHPFFHAVIHQLVGADRWYILPYVTIMFSTGPVFLTNCYYNYTKNVLESSTAGLGKAVFSRTAQPSIDVYFIQEKFNQRLFYEMGSSSWHQWDGPIIMYVFNHLQKFLKTLRHSVQWWSG